MTKPDRSGPEASSVGEESWAGEASGAGDSSGAGEASSAGDSSSAGDGSWAGEASSVNDASPAGEESWAGDASPASETSPAGDEAPAGDESSPAGQIVPPARQPRADSPLLTDYRLQQRDYLLRIARAMSAQLDLREVLALVIRSAVQMTGGEAGAIAMRAVGGGDMHVVASYRLEGHFQDDLAPLLGSRAPRAEPERDDRVDVPAAGWDRAPSERPGAPMAAWTRSQATVEHDPQGARPATGPVEQAAVEHDPQGARPATGPIERATVEHDPQGARSEAGPVERAKVEHDPQGARSVTGPAESPGGARQATGARLATVARQAARPGVDAYHVLTLPLVRDGATVGQIVVFRSEGAAVFTPLDGEVLEAFADQAAVAIQNAYLHERLAARERQLADVVARNPGGILLADAEGRIVGHNPAARAILASDGAPLNGATLVEVLALETDGGAAQPLVLPERATTESVRGFLAGGAGRRGPFVQATVRALAGSGGDIESFVVDIVDLSVYKEAEDTKTAFLAGLSHELKTPLALIQGYGETLQLEDVRLDRSLHDEAIAVILDETDHLTRMVDQLLLAARLQAGMLTLDLDVVDLAGLLAREVEAFRTAHPDHAWELDLGPDLPAVVADPTRLRQVFHNLLGNAAKYAPRGTTVRVAAGGDGPDAVVTVRDEGPGIAPADQGRIFERFVRATDRAEGTGLGLYMSRAIVSAHGGRIDVESGAGLGSTFIVRLPQTGPDAGAGRTVSSEP